MSIANEQNGIILYLPWPPSINNYYTQGAGKSKFVSAKGKRFRDNTQRAVIEQLGDLVLQPQAGRLSLIVELFPPDRRKRDLDNHLKALLDALTLSGVWMDDSQIDKLEVWRGEAYREGLCVVRLGPGPGVLSAPTLHIAGRHL